MGRLPPRRAAAVLAISLAAACDRQPTQSRGTGDAPPAAMAAVTCTGDVRAGSITCQPRTPSAANGVRLDQAIIGGQGRLVQLRSASPAYGGGFFTFSVTVQNLSTLPFGTEDGEVRTPAGVQVFFSDGPVATSGTGGIEVYNADGLGTFVRSGQPYFQYGGEIDGNLQPDLGEDGILSPGETSAPKTWILQMPATVETFSFTLYVATAHPEGTLDSAVPSIDGILPSTLQPGSTATIVGANFAADPQQNTVTIGGAAATVTGGGTSVLQVTVPCAPSGTAAVAVTARGIAGAPASATMLAPKRTLAAGQSLVLTDAADARCNELTATGAASRYVVAVYDVDPSPTSVTAFQVAGLQPGGEIANPAVPGRDRLAAERPRLGGGASLDGAAARAARARAELGHLDVLEKNRRAYEALMRRFGRSARPRAALASVSDTPPLHRMIRVPDRNATSICTHWYPVSATRVYYAGKLAIYEDDATPSSLKAASNPAMAAYWQQLGDVYNAQLEPIVRSSFGDPLRRDSNTDHDGVLIAVSTPLFGSVFGGLAGFVTSCDQFPNDGAADNPVNGASNFGEYVYFNQPGIASSGYSAYTPERWYHEVRTVLVHEAKHVASIAARVANGAPTLEASWLEEGTARHAEELWSRIYVYGAEWKADTGYGGGDWPNGLYCDWRFTDAACLSATPNRPTRTMAPHFASLSSFLTDPRVYSPFGRTAWDNEAVFYGASWSLVRFASDRYASSDASFLRALNEATTYGTENLSARAGVPIERLLGGWALSLFADDYPGVPGSDPDLRFATWNLASIFAGLHADDPGTYVRAYPAQPWATGFGNFTAAFPEIVGGGVIYVELSGTQAKAQVLSLQSLDGGAPSSSLRIAIAHLQ
ncbi:MAG TPA: IPT/TIG domain-containing protein [Longimicrobium sp.]